jgi:hypothetical protein
MAGTIRFSGIVVGFVALGAVFFYRISASVLTWPPSVVAAAADPIRAPDRAGQPWRYYRGGRSTHGEFYRHFLKKEEGAPDNETKTAATDVLGRLVVALAGDAPEREQARTCTIVVLSMMIGLP